MTQPEMVPKPNDEVTDDKPIDPAERSLLNKLMHQKLAELNEGEVEVSLRNDPKSPLYSTQTFEGLELNKLLIAAIYEMGFQQPSKIQEASLPLLLDPQTPSDLVAQSQSGTGKTAAFLLTMLHRLDPNKLLPQCLCVAPTFELALQIGEVAKKMAKYLETVKIKVLVKGEIPAPDTVLTEQIIIGTPGKLADYLFKFKLIDAANIICFVLDEADVMLSQKGYKDISVKIHNEIILANPKCQCLLFSATFTDVVYNFAESLIPDMAAITLRKKDQTLPNIRQLLIRCKTREEKYKAIVNIYNTLTIASSIIFTYTRSSATWLSEQLKKTGRKVGLLHGEMSADERANMVKKFQNGDFRVLITTNVCSRGLDIPSVKLVVNYDPPVTFEENPQPDYDTYLHRIGRTGRFGKGGIAVNLVDSVRAEGYVRKFEEYFNRPIELIAFDDFDRLDEIEEES
ncbi:unnamed protein product [Bursaphelenchus okinawaensis]|uniref:RNA helicase n=1 Tax=Bursaphelenchus okinawaensis TaxID=465554 RepID=A0A811K050_9BILA|nr:unnamed protein product [Bursaphelenchus okinawaensis]CAG9088839.1 unnamed protein product [Bursaphelenchus okinawaensis]